MGRVNVFRAQGDALERLPIEANTLDEATLQTPHGVYTVFRLYPGHRVVRLPYHLARLRYSAELLKSPFPLSDDWLRAMLRRVVEAGGVELPRLRLTVPFDAPDTAIVAVEPFTLPPTDLYERGVWVGLVNMQRELPRAKNSRFVELRRKIEAERPKGVYETMLCNNDGFIREGMSSNFYAVLDGQLRTAEVGMLEGVARSILLEAAPGVLPVRFRAVHLDELARVSEATLTSSSRGVVPVVKVGEMVIGDGERGPITRRLQERYDARIEEEMEPL